MSDRQTAKIQLTFEVNFDHDAPESQRMDAALGIAHDLMQTVRGYCRSSEDRLRFKQTDKPRVMFVHTDKGDSFL